MQNIRQTARRPASTRGQTFQPRLRALHLLLAAGGVLLGTGGTAAVAASGQFT